MPAAEPPHWTKLTFDIITSLAAVAAIIFSLVAVNSSNTANRATAELQAGAETDRSRAEFLRTQRQIAYAKLIDDDSKLSQLYHSSDMQSSDAEKASKSNTAFMSSLGDFSLDVSTVQIIGSDAAIQAASQLQVDYNSVYRSMIASSRAAAALEAVDSAASTAPPTSDAPSTLDSAQSSATSVIAPLLSPPAG